MSVPKTMREFACDIQIRCCPHAHRCLSLPTVLLTSCERFCLLIAFQPCSRQLSYDNSMQRRVFKMITSSMGSHSRHLSKQMALNAMRSKQESSQASFCSTWSIVAVYRVWG